MRRLDIRLQTFNIEWLWKERDEIDFDPEYQRKSHVWSTSNKQYLIDSILNGFDVPKIYLADFSFGVTELNTAGQRYAVIDGKQRIQAVFGFRADHYALPRNFEYYDDPQIDLSGLHYSDIARSFPSIADRFDQFVLAVMSVVTSDPANISQMFVRLNTSKPLTGSELRNAMPGRVPGIIRGLVEHEFLRECLPFSTLRSEDKNLAAKLLLIEHRGAPVDTKKRQLDALVREVGEQGSADDVAVLDLLASTESADFAVSAERVRATLDRMMLVFQQRDPLLRQSGQIPVFYWFVRHMDSVSAERIRRFLLLFQQSRDENKIKAKSGEPTNAELDRYEILMRSSNDAGSIKQRHAILNRWWSRLESIA